MIIDELREDFNIYQKTYAKDRGRGTLGQAALNILEDNTELNLSKEEKTFVLTALDSLDAITVAHVIETTTMAQKITDGFGEYFEDIYQCSANDFKKGILIHDIGKTLVDPNILLSEKYFPPDGEERKQLARHDFYFREAFEIIKEKAGLEKEELFNEQIFDIAEYHHPRNNNKYFRTGPEKEESPYRFLAAQIDVYESLRTDLRPYKTPKNNEVSQFILNQDVEECAVSDIQNTMRNSIPLVASCYDEDFHKKVSESLKSFLTITQETAREIKEREDSLAKSASISTHK